jgi:hypothetical protein
MDEQKSPSEKKSNGFLSVAERYIGQNVACLCARYQYRGILSEVYADCIVIANASCVEVSGACNLERPQTEDAIGGSVVIKCDAIEILYQPNWCNAPLPGTN